MEMKIDELKELCINILTNNNIPKEDSEIIVDLYLDGELRGRKSHGLMNFPKVLDKYKCEINKFKIEKQTDSYALIDGNKTNGQVTGKKVMDLAIEKAKTNGTFLASMNNMNTYLMPGYYARLAADNNLIAWIFNSGGKATVAPPGGIDPVFGTNPLAIGIPTKDSKLPFVLDMATSQRAMGEVRLAKLENKELPEEMAIDIDGNITMDPEKVHALLPLGGYKGFGLGMAISIMAGAMVNAKMGSKSDTNFDRGYVFFIINPEIFTDLNKFKDEVDEFIKEIKSSKKRPETKEIFYPGEHSEKIKLNNLEKGSINIDDNTYKKINELK